MYRKIRRKQLSENNPHVSVEDDIIHTYGANDKHRLPVGLYDVVCMCLIKSGRVEIGQDQHRLNIGSILNYMYFRVSL